MRRFGSGSISAAQLETATVELVHDWFLSDFQRHAEQGAGRFLSSTLLGPTWWEGLTAFSAVFGRELVGGIRAQSRSANQVTFETWGRMIYANARAAVGTLPDGIELPANWAEDSAFAAAWAKAVANTIGNRRLLTMFTLALHWDTFRIPVRFFSDSAALAFIRAALFELPPARLELDSYRKDVRGARSGLGLNGPATEQIVVKYDERLPNVFRVSQSAAAHVGLRVTGFKSSIPGAAKPLVFELHD